MSAWTGASVVRSLTTTASQFRKLDGPVSRTVSYWNEHNMSLMLLSPATETSPSNRTHPNSIRDYRALREKRTANGQR